MTVPHLFSNFVGSAIPPIGTWYSEVELSQHTLGTPDWDNKVNPLSSSNMCLDGSGNVYTLYRLEETTTLDTVAGDSFAVLVKTNSSGVRQWSRFIYGSTEIEVSSMDIDNTNHRIYICGATSQNADGTVVPSNIQTNEVLGWICRIDSINTSSPSIAWARYLAADQTSTRTTGNSNAYGVRIMTIKVNPVNGYLFAVARSWGYYGSGVGTGTGTGFSDPISVLMLRFDVGNGSTQECKIINPSVSGDLDVLVSNDNIAFNSTGHVYTFFDWNRSDLGTDYKDGVLVAKFSNDTNLDMIDCWEISSGAGDEKAVGKFEIDSSDNFHITYQGSAFNFFKSPLSRYLMANSSRVAQRTKQFSREVSMTSRSFQVHALCGSTHIYLISNPVNRQNLNSIWVQKKQIGSDTVDQEYIIENQLTDDVNDYDSQVGISDAQCDGTYLYLLLSSRSTQSTEGVGATPDTPIDRASSSYVLQLPVADFSNSLPSSVPTNWSNRVRSHGFDTYNGDNKLTIKARDWTPNPDGIATLGTSSSSVSWTSLGTNSSDYAGNDTGASMQSFSYSLTMSATLTTEGGTSDLTTIKTEI